MADTDILVSEMTPASQINTTDLMIMTQPDAQAETGYTTKSGTVLQVTNKQLKGIDFPTDLPHFTNQNVLGGLEELKSDIKSLLPIVTASGNPCNFETGITDKLVSLKAAILATGGNGTPSTPIPIVGHSELNLVRCGKNLLDAEVPIITPTLPDPAVVQNINIGVDCVFSMTASADYANSDNYWLVYIQKLDGTRTYITPTAGQTKIQAFTVTNDNPITAIYYRNSGVTAGSVTNFQIELGSTATAYAPYNGTPYLVSFGQTVYGGEYDANRGKVRITHKLTEFDGSSDETWSNYANSDNQYRYWIALTDCKSGSNGEQKSNYLQSTTGVVTSGNSSIIKNNYASCTLFDDGSRVYINANTVIIADTLADFIDYLSNNPLQLLYPLATPIEIDVSSISVDAVSGVNNIVSDCGGDVEVKYRDSIQHYIDSKIASVQALIL